VTAVQKVSHLSPKQIAADRANLAKARTTLTGRKRTAKQVAASRANLVKARAVQRARKAGKAAKPARTAKKVTAPLSCTREILPGTLELLPGLPACGPLALAEHLRIHTGAVVTAADVIRLWTVTGENGTTLGHLFEAAAEHGLGGEKLAYWEQCDPDYGEDGLIYGVQLGHGYHAALAAAGSSMISWCRLVPREGTPEEAWWLEWEGE
jgi:hypothetical protein